MPNKKITFIVIAFLLVFFLIRMPGLDLPYHQDEWKNVSASSGVEEAGKFFAHPPLMQMILVLGYQIFGVTYFRFLPLIFSLASAILLYFVVRSRLGGKAAIWSLAIFTVLFYNILGSLVPDVDGAILPFLFLFSVYLYDKWNAAPVGEKTKWFIFMITVLLVGFLTKLSFILVVGALALDYIIGNWRNMNPKRISYVALVAALFGALYVVLLYVIKILYPAFDISIMMGHANQYSEGIGRNWIQIVVQGVKALFYLSPLALVPLFFISRDTLKSTRVFNIYLVLGLIFYFIIFDFSRGALDKYLMFAIIPLAVLVGSIFAKIFGTKVDKNFWRLFFPIGLILSFGLILLNFLTHAVLPLYPKTLWFSRVLHGDWLILNPFNGGSGPLGFYVSFLFIAMAFIVALALVCVGLFKKEWQQGIALVIILIGFSYNAVFAEELFFGKINGSAPEALAEAVNFIEHDEDIKSVLTYNDTGAGLLAKVGKYAGRIYATPESEGKYKEIFSNHTAKGGHFLVVGIPPLGTETFYGKFFAECDSLYESISGRVHANVYKCDIFK